MDDFCGSKFWDWDLTWATEDPDLTRCFQSTVLVWVPSGFLWILGIFVHALRVRGQDDPKASIPWNPFNISKIIICLILIILQILKLSVNVNLNFSGTPVYSVELYTPVLEIATYALALAAVVHTKCVGIQTTGVEFFFWLLKTICEIAPFRSALRSYDTLNTGDYLILYIVQVISFPLVVGQLLLQCWAENRNFLKNSNSRACPQKESSPLSRLLFCWFDSLAWTGYKKPLETRDIWTLDPENASTAIVKRFDQEWSSKVKGQNATIRKGKKPPPIGLFSVLFHAFGSDFVLGSFIKLIPDLLAFVSPQILNLLILFVNGEEEAWKGYFYVGLLLATDVVASLGRNHHNYYMYMVMFRLKGALMSAIYRKSLVISNAVRKEKTVGEIVNLMSVDVSKILELTPYINILWSSPLQIILAMYFLWQILGPSALAGLTVMLLLIPANAIFTRRLRTIQVAQMKNKDERVKLTAEILSGIKILKLYAWEPSFRKKILDIRAKEVANLRSIAYLYAINDFFWTCSQFMVTLATFSTFVLVSAQNLLDAKTAFVTLALLNVMSTPLTAFPMVVVYAVQASVSLKRLNKFMNAEEIDVRAIGHNPKEKDPVVVKDGSFAWDSQSDSNVLEKINLRVKEGSLVAVVGVVGSGKSSLLSAILGEMEITRGKVNVLGKTSYAAQIPWIQNATLRENILFGKSYESLRYHRVLEACCLNPDLDIFPGRDKIEIGEKGINLSGGQKQRVSVARAIYHQADIYLFDDPLSAVDAHVGKHIFEKVLGPSGLLRKKTRILVTHSVAYLPQVDHIVVLKDGTVSEAGTYQQLIDKQGDFSNFLAQYSGGDQANESLPGEEPPEVDGVRTSVSSSKKSLPTADEDFDSSTFDIPSLDKMSGSLEKSKGLPETQKLIEQETSETLGIPWKTYYKYFQAAGFPRICLSLVCFFFFQVFAVGGNYWLSVWTEAPVVNGTQPDKGYYIGIYTALNVCQSLIFVAATILLILSIVRASAFFQSEMLSRILRAPMSFFDTTPTGRILNRFSKDVDILDNRMDFVVRLWVSMLFQVLGTLSIIVYNLPIFAAVIPPLGILFYLVQKFYIPTSRQVQRLESVTRSPVYANFSETLNGTSTIRAFQQQERFVQEHQNKVDDNQTCYFPSVVSGRWLMLRLELIGSLVVFFTSMFAVMSRQTLNPGAVGLSISYAMNITMLLSWLVRNFCDLETNAVAVERILEYCNVPQEAPLKSILRKPPKSWPAQGAIKYQNYETKYREGLEPVLRHVTFDIQPGEKIGVVGRTGAGKSSLTLALFRLIESTDGAIIIDGEDIGKIGLHDLRSGITIIPQDPVLFTGSLRFNLDPFEKHRDDTIWDALKLAHLSQFVSELPTQLEHTISEGGDNLSVGQKQLVCLARALLRRTKILVLDEATAAVDLETDDLIQQTIRKEFRDATVITIAHRINTVLDSSRILLLEDGQIQEFDSPSKLLEDTNSHFSRMCKDAKIEMASLDC